MKNKKNNSALMVAGDKEKHLDKIEQLECDIAIVNLEDAVFDKKFARELVAKKLKNKTFKNKQIVIRVNDLDSCGKEDIEVLNSIKPDAIRVPKIKTIEDVKLALALINEDIDLHLSIETKEAFENLSKLKIDKRVTTVYLGILDMLESLGLPQYLVQLDNPTIEYILSKFLIDSKIAGFKVISFVYQDYKKTDEFKQWCLKEKSMGFTGKGCISPTQVKIANEVFSVDEKEISKAKYIKKVFEEKQALGISGFVDEKYGFIDEPIYKDSVLLLNKFVI